MRLIDADALLEKTWDADTRAGYVQVVDVGDIEEAPTIEAEPVKHGKWDGWKNSHCSECGCFCTLAYIKDYPDYCPNCGADMRGE